jgi:hypothetical protein
MPHDPARVADTSAWLRKADNDLRAAEHDRTAKPPLLGDVTFHSQQTAEKAFKAFLTWHDKPFRKTHNLEELGGVPRPRSLARSRGGPFGAADPVRLAVPIPRRAGGTDTF